MAAEPLPMNASGTPQNPLKEYEILRNEIADNSRLVAQVFIANTTVTAAIVGFGLSIKDGGGPVFLAPLAILIPSLFFIASQMEQTTIISQYLRVVLEPQVGIRWQGNWYDFRKHQLLVRPRKYAPAVSGLYGSLSVVCLLLAAVTWNPANWWHPPISWWFFIAAALVTGGALISAVWAISRAFSRSYREKIADNWKLLLRMQRDGVVPKDDKGQD